MDFVQPVQAVIPGAQGRMLAVLAETTAELNLSTLARLAGVSVAQASRVMPLLVELGIVERREVPPSSQFRLVRENLAARSIIALARARDSALDLLSDAATDLSVAPVSLIIFGSFARGEADEQSDIDVIVVRPDDVDPDDDRWADSIEQWRTEALNITGNRVETIELSADEVRERLRSDATLWRDIQHDGIVVYGLTLNELREPANA